MLNFDTPLAQLPAALDKRHQYSVLQGEICQCCILRPSLCGVTKRGECPWVLHIPHLLSNSNIHYNGEVRLHRLHRKRRGVKWTMRTD